MAMNDAATILPGRGTVFVGTVGATPPNYKTVDPLTPSTFTGWDCIGHTSRENNVALSKDGGDATVIGSWWSQSLRTSYESVNWGLTFNSLQVDQLTLGLAFGGGSIANGGYTIPDSVVAVEKAVFVLMVDGSGRMGIYSPKSSLTLGDAPEVATDALFEVQISATMLSQGGVRMRWLHPSFDAA